jgi:hypothetical protein
MRYQKIPNRAPRAASGIQEARNYRSLSKTQKYTLNKVIGYLERNKQHMRYDVCPERGYPIGSGVIEGACRNLVNDRLELTGMQWTVQGRKASYASEQHILTRIGRTSAIPSKIRKKPSLRNPPYTGE